MIKTIAGIPETGELRTIIEKLNEIIDHLNQTHGEGVHIPKRALEPIVARPAEKEGDQSGV